MAKAGAYLCRQCLVIDGFSEFVGNYITSYYISFRIITNCQ